MFKKYLLISIQTLGESKLKIITKRPWFCTDGFNVKSPAYTCRFDTRFLYNAIHLNVGKDKFWRYWVAERQERAEVLEFLGYTITLMGFHCGIFLWRNENSFRRVTKYSHSFCVKAARRLPPIPCHARLHKWRKCDNSKTMNWFWLSLVHTLLEILASLDPLFDAIGQGHSVKKIDFLTIWDMLFWSHFCPVTRWWWNMKKTTICLFGHLPYLYVSMHWLTNNSEEMV